MYKINTFKQKLQWLSSLRFRRAWWTWLLTVLIVLSSIIPLRLAITLYQTPVPQAILVLDGAPDRIKFAAQFWQLHPTLEIWLSGCCSNSVLNRSIFRQAGVPEQWVNYDLRATDTVTHFTTLVGDFAHRNIRHLYMITSDYHMARARTLATLFFGSRGIAVTPVSVQSQGHQPESLIRIVRDCIRFVLWTVTGHTGASFNPRLSGCRACQADSAHL